MKRLRLDDRKEMEKLLEDIYPPNCVGCSKDIYFCECSPNELRLVKIIKNHREQRIMYLGTLADLQKEIKQLTELEDRQCKPLNKNFFCHKQKEYIEKLEKEVEELKEDLRQSEMRSEMWRKVHDEMARDLKRERYGNK